MNNLYRRFEVKFGVAGSLDKWSVTYVADDFGEAEQFALETLAANEDSKSYIISIEFIS